jgi:hypothetical protein
MKQLIYTWLNKIYQQNYILKKPYAGAFIIFLFCFGFLSVYKPLGTHGTQNLSYQETMAIYCLAFVIPFLGIITLLKKNRYFSDHKEWTLFKELISIILILSGIGIAVYITGFLVEPSGPRWNLSTFLNSFQSAFLIGIIPFLFFTIINYRSFGMQTISFMESEDSALTESVEENIEIISKLKKERLKFNPSQLLYATSDGNYVLFYLNRNNKIEKEIIRNSISDIDRQLSHIPFFMRTHRAFIVNVKEVRTKKGSTLGYRLKISGIDAEIPVSRSYTEAFNQLLSKFH